MNVIESKYVREAMKELMARTSKPEIVQEIFLKALREERFVGDRVIKFENLIDSRVTRLTQARLHNRDWAE